MVVRVLPVALSISFTIALLIAAAWGSVTRPDTVPVDADWAIARVPPRLKKPSRTGNNPRKCARQRLCLIVLSLLMPCLLVENLPDPELDSIENPKLPNVYRG